MTPTVTCGFYTLQQAASRLGIGKTTAYQMHRAGTFPCPVVQLGKLFKVRITDLERFVNGGPA